MLIKTLDFHSKYALCFSLCLVTCLYCDLSFAQFYKNEVLFGQSFATVLGKNTRNVSNMGYGNGAYLSLNRQIKDKWSAILSIYSPDFNSLNTNSYKNQLIEQGAVISEDIYAAGDLTTFLAGIRHNFRINKFKPFIGLQIGYSSYNPVNETFKYILDGQQLTYASKLYTTSSYAFGTNLGAQYFISDRWALTGEFSYLYSNINSEQLEFNNIQTINAAIGLSYCFSIKALDNK